MYGILAILAFVLLCNCGEIIPDSIKEWWANSSLRKWAYPVLVIVVTVAVALGIEYDVLNWGAIVLPVMLGVPYLWGAILGIWNNMKGAGHKLTSKDDVDAQVIAINCLKELGCQPEINKDGTIGVSYQGENFHMEFGTRYVRIWDPMWAGIKVNDPDMPKIREAVNAANYNFGPTVVMTAPDEDGVIGFHSRRDIMLHPACPDNVPFVKAVLDSFFDAKEAVRNRYQQIDAQQMEAQKNRRPVGFTTTQSATGNQ